MHFGLPVVPDEKRINPGRLKEPLTDISVVPSLELSHSVNERYGLGFDPIETTLTSEGRPATISLTFSRQSICLPLYS